MQLRPNQDYKYELADVIEKLLREDARDGTAVTEITRVAPLQLQVKIIPENGLRRYLLVRVSGPV